MCENTDQTDAQTCEHKKLPGFRMNAESHFQDFFSNEILLWV